MSNRNQFVQSGDYASSPATLKCGVPQGSNLGPLLFLIYINDLPHCTKYLKLILFADDTTGYLTRSKNENIGNLVNSDLERINMWLKANKLTLNVDKTHACHYKPQFTTPIDNPCIDGVNLKMSNSVKCLGIYLDDKLSWTSHINFLTNKINKFIGIISKVRNHMNIDTLRCLYFTMIQSNISYCQEIWSSAYYTTLNPLRIAQKKFIRIVFRASPRSRTTPLFKLLGIRRLNTDISYRKAAVLAFTAIKNPHIYNLDINVHFTHQYATRFRTQNLPNYRTNTQRYGTKGIKNQIIESYNILPSVVKNLQPHQIKLAKRLLKATYNY